MTPLPLGSRVARFVASGAVGFVVQLASLWLLTRAGLHYLPATVLAVEAAIVTNFLWHERLTWADRPAAGPKDRAARLLRFNVMTGVTSILGMLALMAAMVELAGMPPLPANVAAVAMLSAVNFLGADRLVFRAPAAALLVLATSAVPAQAAVLGAKAAEDFERYATAVEARSKRDLGFGLPFLGIDRQPVSKVEQDLQALRRGEVLVARGAPGRADGEDIEVSGGLVNHWRGTVFIPGVTLDRLLRILRDPQVTRHKQEDVVASKVLWRDGDDLGLYLRLRRTKFVTVVYDTEHEVSYQVLSPRRALSRSVATRIVEVEDAGTPEEKARPAGDDHGFLWRLNSYWRYEQVEGGVLVELESLTLSRDIPSLVKPLVRPLVDRVARESIERTLTSVRTRVEAEAGLRVR